MEVPVSKCSCSRKVGTVRASKWTSVAGLFAAVGVCAVCCLLPVALIAAGMTGAMDSLHAFRWIFSALVAVVLGYGFYATYKKSKACAAGSACNCTPGKDTRATLWLATLLAAAGFAFLFIEPMLNR